MQKGYLLIGLQIEIVWFFITICISKIVSKYEIKKVSK